MFHFYEEKHITARKCDHAIEIYDVSFALQNNWEYHQILGIY